MVASSEQRSTPVKKVRHSHAWRCCYGLLRLVAFVVVTGILAFPLPAQINPTTAAATRVEPGLEQAIHWRWRIVPSDDKDWGLPLPVASPAPAADAAGPALDQIPAGTGNPGPAATPPAPERPTQYEVQKGDALILIGKKFGMTPQQLKAFNGLEKDTIRVGQVLKIPTLDELKAIPAPPTPPPKPEPPPLDTKARRKEARSAPSANPAPIFETQRQEDLRLQVFLDREQFSTGPIDGTPGPMLATVSQLYRENHEGAQDVEAFKQKLQKTVPDPLAHYTLKPEDFRFISVPEGKKVSTRTKGANTAAEVPAPKYEELVAAPWLAYRSAWEFVAERFHCDESFLRRLNPQLKGAPAAGAHFKVPNVVPFEIEHAFQDPLQPPGDPEHAVTAAVVGLSRLEISRDGKLLAVMPMAVARPDLRGRGSWTILDAVPRPRLATLRELKDPRATRSAPVDTLVGDPNKIAPPPAVAASTTLSSEQYLAAGPNNPVGIVWVNLAKAKSTEPLPYGLHGTSIPSRMKTQEGIGGIRLTNWDIARAVRLLPAGTPLLWK
ncbi:MAG: LysM peptidoglycan-binding domain-containing protein [Verrucomicrobiales bacterium]